MNKQWLSKIAMWLVIAMVLFTAFELLDTRGGANGGYVGYSELLQEVRSNRIKSATLQEGQGGTEIMAVTHDDRRIRTNATNLDRGLVENLTNHHVTIVVKSRDGRSWLTLLVSWGPMFLLIGVLVYFILMRQIQGGGKGGAFSFGNFGKSKSRMMDENNNTITFAGMAECDEAKVVADRENKPGGDA